MVFGYQRKGEEILLEVIPFDPAKATAEISSFDKP